MSDQPKIRKNPWEEYFDSLNKDYVSDITQLARLDDVEFEFVNPDGLTTTKKTLKRRKLTGGQFNELEEMRAEMEGTITKKEAQKQLWKTYVRSAQLYFGISEEELFNIDWETAKKKIDASTFRTLYGLPRSAPT